MRSFFDRHTRKFHSDKAPQPYQYDKLPVSGPGQTPMIRTLSLRPGKAYSSALTGSLEHHRLDQIDGNYEALSYTWGKPEFTEVITVDGRTLLITKNLDNALRRLRSSQSRRLWVDAVCINQDDMKERNEQVRIMPQIYTRSRQTVIWLGEPRDGLENPEAAIDFLAREARRCRETSAEGSNELSDRCDIVAAAQREENLPQVTAHLVDRLLNTTYFTRRWIIQEILLARLALVVWGPHELPWDDVYVCLQTLSVAGEADHNRLGAWIFKNISWDALSSKDSNVISLMYKFQRNECEDPRDRIAALQGLWRGQDSTVNDFTVDYTETLESNYVRFAKSVAQTADCGRLLVSAALRSVARSARARPGEKLKVPSWVPDWQDDPWTTGPSTCQMEYPASLGADDTLILRGWLVDTVTCADKSKDFIKELKADPAKNEVALRLLAAKPDRYRRNLETEKGLDRSLLYGRFLYNGVAQPGDKICVLTRGSMDHVNQFVIRQSSPGSSTYELIGICEWSKMAREKLTADQEWTLTEDAVEIVLV